MRLIPLTVVICALAAPLMAKPALRDVAEIDDALMKIAIADEIRKECSGIDARVFRALGQLNNLKSKAKAMGYSSAEIKDYTGSSVEKARMRAKAEGWLAARGVDAGKASELCAFGRSEMASGSAIGRLLR